MAQAICGMDAAAETAIGRGDDALAADQVGKAQDALGDQFRVFNDIGGMADDTGQDQFVVGEFDVLPDLPFVLMAHIAGLERIAPQHWPSARPR